MERDVLLDSGVLLRLGVQSIATGNTAANSVLRLLDEGNRLCYTPQNIREVWNVLTRPVVYNGYGLSVEDAEEAVQISVERFALLEDNPQVFQEWRRLVRTYGVMGKNVHDANLVASALAHGVRHIATLNERDFRRYSEIEIVPITLDGR